MTESLITQHIDLWTSAIEAKSTAGRGSKNKFDLYGIKKLRELILELAVRGKLVPQDPTDEPASVLLEKIAVEKSQLIKEKKIKKTAELPDITDEEKPFDLPDSWSWCHIGDLGETFTGKTPNTDDIKLFSGRIPFIGPGQIALSGQLLDPDRFLTEEGILSSTEAKENDVLMVCIGGSIGKSAITPIRMAFNQQINSIRPILVNSKYINYAFSTTTFINSVLENATGSATPIINRSKWESLLVPIPSKAEQNRIVAKVDELMALCDQLEQQTLTSIEAHATLVEKLLETLTNSADATELEQNWARISEHFDTLFTTEQSIDALKQTILQLAVMGKLVRQDPTDEPASVLLEKIAAEKAQLIKDKKIKKEKPLPPISDDEKPFELPKGWEWCRLANFSDVGTGSTPSRTNSSYWQPEEFSWVSSGETGELFVTKTKEKISRLAVKETNISIYPVGTLIVAMYGQGKTRGQITELLIEAGTNQACAAIQLINENVSHKKYIKLFFLKAYEEIRSFAAGGAQPNLNVGKISTTVIPIPPLNEQKRIVTKVEQLMLLCEQLKSRLQQSCKIQLHLTNAIVMQGIEI